MKNKHDHKGTKKIKVCLFSLIMLMPMLAIGFTCLYTTFNENAYESYAGDYKFNETVELKDHIKYTDLTKTIITNPTISTNYRAQKYTYNKNFDTVFYNESYKPTGSNWSNNIILNISSLYINDINYPEINAIQISTYIESSKLLLMYTNQINEQNQFEYGPYNYYMIIYNQEGTHQIIEEHRINLNTPIKIEFYLENDYFIGGGYNENISNETYNKTIGSKLKTDKWYIDRTISAVFYASTNRVWQAPLFNWVMNGPFYNAMIGFTSIFGIPNQTFFTNILVYWLTMTCIYVIIDIVIEVFIYITHLLNIQKDDM